MFEAQFIRFYIDRIEAAWPNRSTTHVTRTIRDTSAAAAAYLRTELPGQYVDFANVLQTMADNAFTPRTLELTHGSPAYQNGLRVNWEAVQQAIEDAARAPALIPDQPIYTQPVLDEPQRYTTSTEVLPGQELVIDARGGPTGGEEIIVSEEETVTVEQPGGVPDTQPPPSGGPVTVQPVEVQPVEAAPRLDDVTLANIFRKMDSLLSTNPADGLKLAHALYSYMVAYRQAHPRLVALIKDILLVSATPIEKVRNDPDWTFAVRTGDLYLAVDQATDPATMERYWTYALPPGAVYALDPTQDFPPGDEPMAPQVQTTTTEQAVPTPTSGGTGEGLMTLALLGLGGAALLAGGTEG